MFDKIKKVLLRIMPSSIAGRLRAWRIRRLIDSYSPRVVEHEYGNNRFKVYLADPLAQGWYDNDWTELPEITLLRTSKLQPGARVFDIGAHQGVVALMLASEVGTSGQVVAVEPSPHNCAAALKNQDLNGAVQMEVIQAAVSEKTGTLSFGRGLNGQIDDGTGARGQFDVDSTTIDALAIRFGMPDLVFIDVEGAEHLALEGAYRVLQTDADFFVEVHVGYGLEKLGGSVEKVLSYFPQERYSLVGRAEADKEFRLLTMADHLFSDRFFLIARRKRS